MINNNYDTLISEIEIWPLRPFLSETLDEGQTLRVGVLPGTVIFPDFEESYSPLDGDDIKYFNLKEEEGIYLYLEASYSMNPKYGKMNIRDPEIAIACVLKPSQKLAIKAVDKEIEALKNRIEYLLGRIEELEDELSNETDPELRLVILNDIEEIKCFIEPTSEPTTEGPTTEGPTTPAPTLPENPPLDLQERYLTASAYYEKNVEYPEYPPRLSGFSGICWLNQEILRLEKVKGILEARYSIAEGEERKNSIRYYVHNSVKISSVKLSIVKIKNPENEEKDGSIKVYFPLGSAIYISDKLELSSEQKSIANQGVRPQLILSYGVSNKPTNTYKSMEILKYVYEGFLKENTTINFSLGYV